MCCMRVNTDVILANIFSVQRIPVTLNDLTAYINYLFEVSPTYVTTDLNEESVRSVVSMYPGLYTIEEYPNGNFVVSAGSLKPKLQFFNKVYPDSIASYLQRVTKAYLQCKV